MGLQSKKADKMSAFLFLRLISEALQQRLRTFLKYRHLISR